MFIVHILGFTVLCTVNRKKGTIYSALYNSCAVIRVQLSVFCTVNGQKCTINNSLVLQYNARVEEYNYILSAKNDSIG